MNNDTIDTREWWTYSHYSTWSENGGLFSSIVTDWLGGLKFYVATTRDAIYLASGEIGIRSIDFYGEITIGRDIYQGGISSATGVSWIHYLRWYVATI